MTDESRSAHIRAATARARPGAFPNFERSNVFMFDPDRPHEDPNDMLNRMGGRMTDPHAMNHGCPYCDRVMTWDLFTAHAEACFTKWRKVVLNVERRKFTGATIGETR